MEFGKKAAVIVLSAMALLAFAAPFLALAADQISIWPTGYWGPLVACGGNICTSLCDLLELGQRLTAFGITIVVFIIGPIMFVYGGMKLIMAGGAEEKIKSGRKTILDAVIGMAVALCTWLILSTFLWGIGLIASGPGGEPAGGATRTGTVQWPNIQCSFPGS